MIDKKSTPNTRASRQDASLRPVFGAVAVMLYGAALVALFGHFNLNHIPVPSAITIATVTSGVCLFLLIARWLDLHEANRVARPRTKRRDECDMKDQSSKELRLWIE